MIFEETARMTLLYDFYGGLLTDRQRSLFHMYYEDDLSLGEIAAGVELSRQGVHDALRKAAAALEQYENTLGLARKFRNAEEIAGRVRDELDRITNERGCDAGLRERLTGIRAMIDSLEV